MTVSFLSVRVWGSMECSGFCVTYILDHVASGRSVGAGPAGPPYLSGRMTSMGGWEVDERSLLVCWVYSTLSRHCAALSGGVYG